MARGKQFTQAEQDAIRLYLKANISPTKIAKLMGRGRSTIYNHIKEMTETGEIGQEIMDVGQTGADQ